MKRLFQILAIAVVLAFSASSCAIFTEEPQVVERHYYSPYYNTYPGGVYYWYGQPYYPRPPYAAPHYHYPYQNHHGYTPRPPQPRPEVHRPSPRPSRPSAPTVPAPPRQPANTPPVNYHKAPR